MKNLAERLRAADPLAQDPGLTADEASAMRRRVVQEAVVRPVRGRHWRGAVTIAAGLAFMVAVGVMHGRRLAAPVAPRGGTVDPATAPAQRRQLQFATPGGTRIIWTFDSEFSLKETMP